ncbi:MAG: response regulator, partial [Deltaproteobacteria bacterium]|nr:response regulator [Deltaproteobacteria bacterium]
MSIRAIVVDDEPLARDELRFMLGQCEDVEVVGEARNAPEAQGLCDEELPDVAFLDLRMPGPDGVALAETLMANHPDLKVVIVSAHDEGALRAFEARVADYLLKPVRLERLRQAVERVRSAPAGSANGTERLDRIAVRRKEAYVVLELGDVIYFEVKDELVWAVTKEDRFAIDKTLANLEDELDPDAFFRSHRGFIVRYDRIRAIEPTGAGTYQLLLDHPEEPKIPLARERAKKLRERIPFSGSSNAADEKQEPPPPSGTMSLQGMYSYMADAGVFVDCATQERWPVAHEGDNATLERAYGKAKIAPGAPLLVTVEGGLDLRPKVDGRGKVKTLIIQRFVRTWPRETCGWMQPVTLEDTTWALLELKGKAITVKVNDKAPYLELNSKKASAYGFGGCNRFFGSYETSERS